MALQIYPDSVQFSCPNFFALFSVSLYTLSSLFLALYVDFICLCRNGIPYSYLPEFFSLNLSVYW